VIRLKEYLQVSNNLYVISEAHDVSLVEHLPYLIHQNQRNELVSVLVIYDMLKILKNIYM
jgi:hypothetical protein